MVWGERKTCAGEREAGLSPRTALGVHIYESRAHDGARLRGAGAALRWGLGTGGLTRPAVACREIKWDVGCGGAVGLFSIKLLSSQKNKKKRA